MEGSAHALLLSFTDNSPLPINVLEWREVCESELSVILRAKHSDPIRAQTQYFPSKVFAHRLWRFLHEEDEGKHSIPLTHFIS